MTGPILRYRPRIPHLVSLHRLSRENRPPEKWWERGMIAWHLFFQCIALNPRASTGVPPRHIDQPSDVSIIVRIDQFGALVSSPCTILWSLSSIKVTEHGSTVVEPRETATSNSLFSRVTLTNQDRSIISTFAPIGSAPARINTIWLPTFCIGTLKPASPDKMQR